MKENNQEPKAITAERIGWIIQARDDFLKNMSAKLNIDEDTIKHWRRKTIGIPDRHQIAVALYLQVDPSFLTDAKISRDDFLRLISAPALKEKYRPFSKVYASVPELKDKTDTPSPNPQLMFLDNEEMPYGEIVEILVNPKIQINPSFLDKVQHEILDLYENKLFFHLIDQMDEQTRNIYLHFIKNCSADTGSLKIKGRLEDLKAVAERNLTDSHHVDLNDDDINTALRAINYVNEEYDDLRYHEIKGLFYMGKLIDLIVEIKNPEDITQSKFERLQWLLEATCIERGAVCHRNNEYVNKPDYSGQLRAILLIIEFGFSISNKETLYEFFEDITYDYYFELLKRANTILKYYTQDQESVNHDPALRHWIRVMQYFHASLEKPVATPSDE